MFNVGIGPSSRHTAGPLRAARLFAQHLAHEGQLPQVARIRCGLSDSLIAHHRDVIAADHACVFPDRNLRVGKAALDKDGTLQQTQRDRAYLVRQRAQAMLLQLSQKKKLLHQEVSWFRAVSSHLEQLERRLRSQHAPARDGDARAAGGLPGR